MNSSIGDEVVSINGENYADHTHESFILLTEQDSYQMTIKRTNGDSMSVITHRLSNNCLMN
jgi:hypothetical protein